MLRVNDSSPSGYSHPVSWEKMGGPFREKMVSDPPIDSWHRVEEWTEITHFPLGRVWGPFPIKVGELTDLGWRAEFP